MKRFLLLTLVALFLGLGIGMTSTVSADYCNTQIQIVVLECYAPQCPLLEYPHARYACGILQGSGEPCKCEFQACQSMCK